MVIDAILNIFITALEGLVALLPSSPAPPNLAAKVTSAFGGVGGGLAFISDWLPLDELGTALAAMLVWMVAVHGLRLLGWLLALVHVGGTDA